MSLKVSIVTVVLNGLETIEDTMKSVGQQDHGNIEHVVIDGCSTDGTLDIIEKYAHSIDTFVSEPDKGLYDAMNKGIRRSTGDIIATLNSDDVYAGPEIVRTMVDFLTSNNLDAAYGDLVYTDTGCPSKIVRYWQAGQYEPRAFYYGWVPPHPTFFCRRKLFEKYGYFKPEYRIAADFELMLRLMERHQIKVGYLPQTIVRMGSGGRASTIRGILRGNYEIFDSFRVNGLRFSPMFLLRKPLLKIKQLINRKVKTDVL